MRLNDYNKEWLIQMCALTTSCIRDFNSLYRQYRECIYNESDLLKPDDDKLNLLYRYHEYGVKVISQRMIYIDEGIYLYMFQEQLLIVVGNHKNENQYMIHKKIIKYIESYSKITSNICPNVVWCCMNMYIENMKNLMDICMSNVKHIHIYHDIFIIGYIGDVYSYMKTNSSIRFKTFIALEEEKVKKKEYMILEGYEFDLHNSNIQDFTLTIMNRISNI